MSDFSLAAELKGSEMAQAICDNKIEAMIYTVGHPAAAVTQASSSCDVELVSVTGAPIDKLVADNSFYRVASVLSPFQNIMQDHLMKQLLLVLGLLLSHPLQFQKRLFIQL